MIQSSESLNMNKDNVVTVEANVLLLIWSASMTYQAAFQVTQALCCLEGQVLLQGDSYWYTNQWTIKYMVHF